MAVSIDRTDHQTWTFTREEILALSDRLFSKGVSKVSTLSQRDHGDCINASRLLVQLMLRLEKANQRTVHTIMLGGMC